MLPPRLPATRPSALPPPSPRGPRQIAQMGGTELWKEARGARLLLGFAPHKTAPMFVLARWGSGLH
eukprot:11154298-Lingulodinium_polyedra.AAC.1